MKKYISIILLAFFAVVGSAAQNTISISSGQGVPGDIVTVDVSLRNSDEVTAVEVVIPLVDRKLTYVDGSCVINNERANGHQLNAAVVDGALKIYIYSISLAPLKSNDGKIASFSLKLGKSPAEYTLQPQAVLSNVTGKALQTSVTSGAVTVLAPQIEIVTQSIDYGHVPIMAQYTKALTLRNSGTLPLEVTGMEFSASEFSSTDNSFTIAAGATKSISIAYYPTKRGAMEESIAIMSNAVNGKATAVLIADPYSVNELHSSRAEGIAGEEVTVELRMNNMEPIVGLQTTFALPDGIEYVDGSFAPTERAASHTAVASVSNGKLSLFLYSSANTPMSGNDGVVATFRLRLDCNSGSYKITPQNTVLSNTTVENMVSAVNGEYIVVKSPNISGNKELDFGKTPVTEIVKANYSIRNSGKATLVINDVAFLSDSYRVTNDLPLSVAAGATAALNVEYTPTTEGAHSTIMNIYSNDPDEKLKSVKVSGTVYEPNNLTFEGENLQNGDYVVSIGLDNYTGIVAMQMDIHWMPGMTTSGDRLKVSERLARHSCSITKMDEDTYRFIAFSFSNNSIAGNEGKLFDLTFTPANGVDYKDTPIVIDNVVLSSSGASDYTSQLALNVLAEYSHYYVRFMCEGELVSECFQKVGSAVVYPQMPERTGHSLRWELEGGNTTLAYPIDIAANADNMLYSNAYCTVSGGDKFQGWHVLFDGNDGTFFHSEYASDKPSSDGLHHYLRVDLGAGNEVERFSFTYATRRGYTAGSPTRIVVEGSNVADGGYEEIAVLTGMPTSNSTYSSDILGNGNRYRFIRFRVINTSSNQSPSGHPFFYISEFGMTKYVKVPTVLETVPSNDVVLNGLYTLNSYRVTYKVDGEIVATDSVVYGNEIILREFPSKEGHTFSGWSDTPVVMPAEDVVVEGSFSVNSYNLIYKVDGEEYETVPVVYGTPVTLIEAPTKVGHTFGGWKVEQSETPGVYPIDIAGNADNMLYSNAYCTNTTWGDEFKGWHVLFDGNDGTIFHSEYANKDSSDGLDHYLRVDLGEGNEIEKFSFTYTTRDRNCNVNTPTKIVVEGADEPDGAYAEIATLTGLPTTNSTVYSSGVLSNGNAYRYIRFRVTETPTNHNVHGHPFFFIAEFGMTRHVDSVAIPERMPAGDIVIEGTFAVNSYTLTYMVDGEVYASDNIVYGTPIAPLEEPVAKEGYTFSGWSDIPETMPAGNVVIEGRYVPNSLTGDINKDGVVDVLDIVAVVNYSLKEADENRHRYDVNGDGTVDVIDIVKVVNLSLE